MGSIPQGFSSQQGIDGLNVCAQSADVLIIVPAYNEEANIEKVVRKLERLPYDYVVINDGSRDATPRILDDLQANHIDLCQNLGIGGAVQTGYKYALNHGYQIAVQFDGDGQHDESCIDRLIQPILDGKADMTVGSRFVGEGNAFKSTVARRAGITILSALIKLITGQRIYDVTSGFRAVNQDVLREFVQYYPHDYPEPESLSCMISLGKRVQEVGVVMHERQGGTSSIGAKSALYYMLKVGLAIIVRPYGSKER